MACLKALSGTTTPKTGKKFKANKFFAFLSFQWLKKNGQAVIGNMCCRLVRQPLVTST
jgi:hypothetical protein